MPRWLFALFLGWLLLGGLYAHGRHEAAAREAAELRACQCTEGASSQLIELPSDVPLEEQLVTLVRAHTGKPTHRAEVGALQLHRLQLSVAAGSLLPTTDLELIAELPPETTQLAFLFESRERAADGTERVARALALAPRDQLGALGKDRCGTALPIQRGDQVTAAIAAIDRAGNLGPVARIAAHLGERSDELDPCRDRYGCGLGATMLVLVGACAAFIAFLVLLAGLMLSMQRRGKFDMAVAEPISLAALDRVCTRDRREQLAYLVLTLTAAAGLALRYPTEAGVSLSMLPFALLAAWRYHAVRRLQRVAERPGATCYRRGPGLCVNGKRGRRVIFRPELLDRALQDELPAMRARGSSK